MLPLAAPRQRLCIPRSRHHPGSSPRFSIGRRRSGRDVGPAISRPPPRPNARRFPRRFEVGIPFRATLKECPLPGSDRSPVGHFTGIGARTTGRSTGIQSSRSCSCGRPTSASSGGLRKSSTARGRRTRTTSPPESADLAQRAGVTPSSAAPKKSRSLWVWAGSAALVGLFAATIAHEMDTQQKKKAAELPYFPATP